MITSLFNWRTGLALVAIVIVGSSVFYSQYLAKKIIKEERLRVEQWVEAAKLLVNDSTGVSTRLVTLIIPENKTIPIIVTNEKGEIITSANLDSAKISSNASYVQEQLKQFRSQNTPIEYINPQDSAQRDYYYYGHTKLLSEVKYFPLIQLLIVALLSSLPSWPSVPAIHLPKTRYGRAWPKKPPTSWVLPSPRWKAG
jgi:hypothetical protein